MATGSTLEIGNTRSDFDELDDADCPACISSDLWRYLGPSERTVSIATAKKVYPPFGVDNKFWDELPAETKDAFWKAHDDEKKVERITSWRTCKGYRKSNLYGFLTGKCDDEDMDTKVSSMALISALVLTIPFGLFTGLGNDYWSGLSQAITNCGYGGDIGRVKDGLLNNLVAALVASVLGIILSTFYYLFKPPDAKRMTLTTQKKLKVLVTMLFFSCVVSLVCIINSANIMSANYMVDYDFEFCRTKWNTNDYRGFTGIVFLIIGLLVGIYLVW